MYEKRAQQRRSAMIPKIRNIIPGIRIFYTGIILLYQGSGILYTGIILFVDTGGVLTSSLGVNTAQPGGCLAQLPRCREGNSLEQ